MSSNSESSVHASSEAPFQSAKATSDSTLYKDENNMHRYHSSVDSEYLSPSPVSRQSQVNHDVDESLERNCTASLRSECTKLPVFQDLNQYAYSNIDSTFFQEENSITSMNMDIFPPTPKSQRHQETSSVMDDTNQQTPKSQQYQTTEVSMPDQQVTQDITSPTLDAQQYQIHEVDMLDDDIMMMTIDIWDIGPQVSSYIQNTDITSNGLYLCPLKTDAATLRTALLSVPRRNVQDYTIAGLLSGVDWS
jgi:hypothetical protein